MLKQSTTHEVWAVRGLRDLDGLTVQCDTADQVAEVLEAHGTQDSVVVRTVTRTAVDVYEYTPAEFLGEPLEPAQ